MIIWISSYPKSGNTLVRSLLSSYFFSEDGVFDFELLNNIKQFPNSSLFSKLGIDTGKPLSVIKNYIKAQEIINEKKGIKFLKTHSSFFTVNNKYSFTNSKNSIGVIYIVRDPRNIVTSLSNHTGKTIDNAAETINENFIFSKSKKKDIGEYVGSWSFNYNSWKIFNNVNRYLLIKYEDLIEDTENNFLKILNFINFLTKSKRSIDEKKLKKCVTTTSFERLQHLENKFGFEEASKDELNNNNKRKFYYLGKKNNWKDILDKSIVKKIENGCYKEMEELGYI